MASAHIRHIIPLTTIARDRVLPKAGRVIVRKGQKVSASDVVAESIVAPAHLLMNIARGLGVPANQVGQYMQRQNGEQVEADDIIAGPVGVAKRVVRAPKAGKIIITDSEQVLLETQGRPFELRAGYSGIITDLVPDRGVRIETTGALVQGIWGNGRMDSGVLTVLASSAGEVLTSNRLDISMRGAVVLGGSITSADVFLTAAEVPLRGIIVGSMPSELIPAAAKCAVPVIILDGFGQAPMNSSAYKLLSTSERREAMVVADALNPYSGACPEVVIALPASDTLPYPLETTAYQTGQSVRIIRPPHMNSIGSIQRLLPGKLRLPNGISANCAEIRLENNENVVLPLANLEVLV